MADDPVFNATLGACPACGVGMTHPTVCIACGKERQPDHLGALLAGKYKVVSRLDSGGMGDVFIGEHVELKEPVAIKFLRGTWARVPEFRTRFRREAIALARLRHPAIVSVIDFGEQEGDLFMVMELVRGAPLSKAIANLEAPMPFNRIALVFDQVLEVLEAAHAAGIVHRDLKSENVMVTEGPQGPRVKVLDFGLASIEDGDGGPRLTVSGAVQGTPSYMSPEQCRGNRVGPPTDVYAVGIMLFEALAGALPFESAAMAGLMAQHMFVEAPRPSDVGLRREIPAGLETVVRHAIAKEAADRPTATAMREALRAAMSGTDADAMAIKAAQERSRVGSLSRSERALSNVEPARDPAAKMQTPVGGDRPRVTVWTPSTTRGPQLRDALAVNGFAATLVSGDAPPALDGVKVVVLVADAKVVERARGLKGAKILIADAGDALKTAELIRAGASDVAMASAGDDEVSRKVWRLVKRGR